MNIRKLVMLAFVYYRQYTTNNIQTEANNDKLATTRLLQDSTGDGCHSQLGGPLS